MPTDGKALLEGYTKLDRALVRAGWHATSPAWMRTLKRFWLSERTRLTVRKGRQAGGSTTMARVAVATALYGKHRIPKGGRLGFPFVSVSMDEARERLRNIREVLKVLRVPHTQSGDTIELDERIYFQVLACSTRTSRGRTAGALWEDETALWWSEDDNANPAAEVDAALVPSLVTQPNARIYTISSPLAFDDFHAELVATGNTDDQLVVEGPTWLWNPTITEKETHRLQPDARRWQREFAAVPTPGVNNAFEQDWIDSAFRPVEITALGEPIGVLDPSSGKHDTFTWGVFRRAEVADGRSVILCEFIDGLGGRFYEQTGAEALVGRIATVFRNHGVRTVHSDQRESYALSAHFRARGFSFEEHVWGATTTTPAVEVVRGWLRDGALVLPEHEQLRKEMMRFEEHTKRRQSSFAARGGGRDDFVSLLVTCGMAAMEHRLSPARSMRGRRFAGSCGGTPDPEHISVGGHEVHTSFSYVDGRLTSQVHVGGGDYEPLHGRHLSMQLAPIVAERMRTNH